MSLHSMITEVLARPAPEKRLANITDGLLWRGLLGLAIIFLLVAGWRVLELTLGPILAPLIMALALALTAGILMFIQNRRRRRLKETTPSIAPLVATVLEIAFAPKAVRWFALGSLIYDVATGQSPIARTGSRRRNTTL